MKKIMLLALVMMTACASMGDDYKTYLAQKGVTDVSPAAFESCRGYGCRIVDHVKLSDSDWADFKTLFKDVSNAEQERQKIALAIGMMETKVGAITGTKDDAGGTYVKIGDHQQDCVDESVNTTIYLSVLKDEGLLKFHDIGTPRARIPPFSRGLGPHQTAVIADTGTGEHYAVDSWFHDNGRPAEIIPINEWFFGWCPKG